MKSGRWRAALSASLCLCGAWLPASEAWSQSVDSEPRKRATVTRVSNGAIRVDGRLDDEAWRKATPITDFIQKEPVEGAPPTDAMEVRLVYDEDSLYVGARMHSRDGRIQAPLGRRDSIGQVLRRLWRAPRPREPPAPEVRGRRHVTGDQS